MARISAVVCTYDRYDLLPKAVDSLMRQSLPIGDFRIVVVDNSPDQEAAARFGERYRDVGNLDYVLEKTPGLSNARNVAARQCGTEFVAFMDDDAIASATWLAAILRAFEQFGPDVGIVGGRVDPIWELPRPSWLHDRLLAHLSAIDWGGETRIAAPHEWFAGTNVSYRTALILEHGGFPALLGRIGNGASLLSNEEIALAEAIRAAGKVMVYAPLARVEHLVEKRRLSRTWFRKRTAWQATSDFILHPDDTLKRSQAHWRPILDYFNALPPKERSIRGLFLDTDDADVFLRQMGAIYMTTVAHLAGFEHAER